LLSCNLKKKSRLFHLVLSHPIGLFGLGRLKVSSNQAGKEEGIQEYSGCSPEIDRVINKAAANKCRGLKTTMSYWRPLVIGRWMKLKQIKSLKPCLRPSHLDIGRRREPKYQNQKLTEALRSYQDYLIKHVYVKAGEVGIPMVIHLCAAYTPEMRPNGTILSNCMKFLETMISFGQKRNLY